MIPVLGIPTLNQPKLLRRLIESIDYPIDRLVIVQNGPDECLPQILPKESIGDIAKVKPGRTIVITHPNAGVAGSWNEIIKLFPAPWWMLSNDDIQFAPGDLARMSDFADANQDKVGHIYGNHGASWFVATRYGVNEAGLWDECIMPAYLEDCDMAYRMDLLGVKRVTVQGCSSIHGWAKDGADGSRGSNTVNVSPEMALQNSHTHNLNFQYYFKKWGGLNGQEKFQHPFNNPNLPIDYWKFDLELRAKQQWKLPA